MQIILWIYTIKEGFILPVSGSLWLQKAKFETVYQGTVLGCPVVEQCSHNEGIPASWTCWGNCWSLTIFFLWQIPCCEWREEKLTQSVERSDLSSWWLSGGEVPPDPVWLSVWNLKLNCLICLPYNYLHFLCLCHHFSS